jgi:phenylacetate-CoA ligase
MALFDPLRLGTVALDVLAATRARPQDIAARQAGRLAQLLEAAVRGSRLYRELYRAPLRGRKPADVALSELPRVTKSTLMPRFDDWVTDPNLTLAALRSFTADVRRIGESFLGRYLVWESSGTGGEPAVFVQDARALAVYDALEAVRRPGRVPQQRWIDPMLLGERTAFVGVTSGHFTSYVSVQRMRKLNPWVARAVHSFSIMQPTSQLVDALNAFAPTIVATYPTAAAMLADEARRGRLRIAPREVWTGGETLSAPVRHRIEQTWGCCLRNTYGASEFLSIGSQCEHGRLHANADWVILEPVDAHHRPVPAGQPSHSTLLTNLANHVQPVIRYELGDQVTISPLRCTCGSPMPVIDVQGRHDEALSMEGRHGQPVTLLPLALTTVLEDEAGVFDFQLRQIDARTLALRLTLPDADGRTAMARCCRALHAFAREQGLKPIHVVEELGGPVPRGRSGKLRRVVGIPAGAAASSSPHAHLRGPVR